MTWKLCQKLKTHLERAGVTVLLTRQSPEEDPELVTRGRMAEDCDLFLSIHSNAGGGGVADYPLACCSVDGSADAIGFALAKTVRETMDTVQTARIWKRDYQTGIGTMLFSAADPMFGRRTAPLDYYGVLRGAAQVNVPGVLLECSFHDHPQMVPKLLDDHFLDTLALALTKTLLTHYDLPFEEADEDIDWQERYDALLEALEAVVREYKEMIYS